MNANVVLGIMATMMVGMIIMTIGMISVLRQFNEVVRVLEENDKETPMKPYHSENGYRRCGRCHLILKSTNGVPFRYCSYCGQRVGRGNE